MKFILIFFLVSTAAFVMPKVLTPNSKQNNTYKVMNEQTDSTKLSPDSSWFETQLGIYIQEDYVTFDPVKYKHELSQGARDTLGFEYWLGDFTIKAMDSTENCITLNLSTEEHTKIMFITPDYFVLTSYMPGENDRELTYGSSLLYFPDKNFLQELDTIIVYGVKNNILTCSIEHYGIGEREYKEFGRYDVMSGKFTRQNK